LKGDREELESRFYSMVADLQAQPANKEVLDILTELTATVTALYRLIEEEEE